MSKWYEVTVQAWKVVVVEIEDDTERETPEYLMNSCCLGRITQFRGG